MSWLFPEMRSVPVGFPNQRGVWQSQELGVPWDPPLVLPRPCAAPWQECSTSIDPQPHGGLLTHY